MIKHKHFISKLTDHINLVCGENYSEDDMEVIFGSSLFYIISRCLEDGEGVETEIGNFVLDKNDIESPKLAIETSDDITNLLYYKFRCVE